MFDYDHHAFMTIWSMVMYADHHMRSHWSACSQKSASALRDRWIGWEGDLQITNHQQQMWNIQVTIYLIQIIVIQMQIQQIKNHKQEIEISKCKLQITNSKSSVIWCCKCVQEYQICDDFPAPMLPGKSLFGQSLKGLGKRREVWPVPKWWKVMSSTSLLITVIISTVFFNA